MNPFQPGTPSALKAGETGAFDPSGAYREFREFLARELSRMQTDARHLLANRSEIGSFIPNGRFASLVKATFRSDRRKPLSVMQARVSVNLRNEDLVFPIFHLDTPLSAMLKELIQLELSGDMLRHLSTQRGRTGLLDGISLAEKLGDEYHPESPRRKGLESARSLLDHIEFSGVSENAEPGFEKESRAWKKVFRFLEDSGALRRGFRSAVESLTGILEKYGVSYRHCEYHKNILELHLREFEREGASDLPDEHFTLDLVYQDAEQIEEERQRYAAQTAFYGKEIELLEDVAEAVKRSPLSFWIIRDYEDLVRRTSSWRLKHLRRQDLAHEGRLKGNEIPPETRARETEAERKYKRYQGEINELKNRLEALRKRAGYFPGAKPDIKRELLAERIELLEEKVHSLEFQSSPFQLQPGLRLEALISTGKEKRYTLEKISRVISDFIMDVVENFGENLSVEPGELPPVSESSNGSDPAAVTSVPAPAAGAEPVNETPEGDTVPENTKTDMVAKPLDLPKEAEKEISGEPVVTEKSEEPTPSAPFPKPAFTRPPKPEIPKAPDKNSNDDWVELDEL